MKWPSKLKVPSCPLTWNPPEGPLKRKIVFQGPLRQVPCWWMGGYPSEYQLCSIPRIAASRAPGGEVLSKTNGIGWLSLTCSLLSRWLLLIHEMYHVSPMSLHSKTLSRHHRWQHEFPADWVVTPTSGSGARVQKLLILKRFAPFDLRVQANQ